MVYVGTMVIDCDKFTMICISGSIRWYKTLLEILASANDTNGMCLTLSQAKLQPVRLIV